MLDSREGIKSHERRVIRLRFQHSNNGQFVGSFLVAIWIHLVCALPACASLILSKWVK